MSTVELGPLTLRALASFMMTASGRSLSHRDSLSMADKMIAALNADPNACLCPNGPKMHILGCPSLKAPAPEPEVDAMITRLQMENESLRKGCCCATERARAEKAEAALEESLRKREETINKWEKTSSVLESILRLLQRIHVDHPDDGTPEDFIMALVTERDTLKAELEDLSSQQQTWETDRGYIDGLLGQLSNAKLALDQLKVGIGYDSVKAENVDLKAEVERLTGERASIVQNQETIYRELNEAKARLAAIDAAKEGEPPMPGLELLWLEGLEVTTLKTASANIKWGARGWEIVAALKVELEKAKREHLATLGRCAAMDEILQEVAHISDQPFTEEHKDLPAWVKTILATRTAQAREEGAREVEAKLLPLLRRALPHVSSPLGTLENEIRAALAPKEPRP